LTHSAWAPKLDVEVKHVPLPGLEALDMVLSLLDLPAALLAATQDLIAQAWDASPLHLRVRLPGPTGECNSMHFAPRGVVGCVAADIGSLLVQLVAAFATGNQVLLPAGAESQRVAEFLPDLVEVVEDLTGAVMLDAVLFSGDESGADALRRRLAARDGALVPLVLAGEAGYELHRLVVERALSVNTTAAGGNASLMSLGA
jgi:RHH-type proline utilization regulon transcriptional repressor/proline dehydrogenase/delta 1-pyrroline-5-carboxylate dehydrogenase